MPETGDPAREVAETSQEAGGTRAVLTPGSAEARREFRTFGPDLSALRDALEAAGAAHPVEERDDLYIVMRDGCDAGLKLRGGGGGLDLKLLRPAHGPGELWQPAAAADLPLPGGEIEARFLAPMGVRPFLAAERLYDRAALLEAVGERPDLEVVRVRKRRRQFDLGPDLGEWAELEIGGRAGQSVALESVDAARLEAMIGRFGLGDAENVSYPRYLDRLVFGGKKAPPEAS